MKGTRLYASNDALPIDYEPMHPGEYVWLPRVKMWQLCAPNGDMGVIHARGGHSWSEHADGTVTIAPSIQFETGARWHGYLEAGMWRLA